MTRIHTIGHSTRTAAELLELLNRNGVGLVVDVRRHPGSRRHPQHNREALESTLAAAGVEYRHAPELGGRRSGSRLSADSANQGWRNPSFRAYADHMATAEFCAEIDRLMAEAAERWASGAGTVAIMCAEAVPWQCHRNLISDALVARGAEVLHIIGSADPAGHELHEMARVDDAGGVTYPRPDAPQGELFD